MIRRQLTIFLIVGCLTVAFDFICYRSLMAWTMLPTGIAKTAGFLTGTLFAYFANRAWTFGRQRHAPGSAWRFGLLYAVSLGANVAINAACLALLSPMASAVALAFLAATGVSTCLNFIGMKLFVFADRAVERPV